MIIKPFSAFDLNNADYYYICADNNDVVPAEKKEVVKSRFGFYVFNLKIDDMTFFANLIQYSHGRIVIDIPASGTGLAYAEKFKNYLNITWVLHYPELTETTLTYKRIIEEVLHLC